MKTFFKGEEDFQWWPAHVQTVFTAIGQAMGEKRLNPQTLRSVPSAVGGILPGHQVTIRHVSGKELGRRKGHYLLIIDGPIFAGSWRFFSGNLETLSRSAAKAVKGRGDT